MGSGEGEGYVGSDAGQTDDSGTVVLQRLGTGSSGGTCDLAYRHAGGCRYGFDGHCTVIGYRVVECNAVRHSVTSHGICADRNDGIAVVGIAPVTCGDGTYGQCTTVIGGKLYGMQGIAFQLYGFGREGLHHPRAVSNSKGERSGRTGGNQGKVNVLCRRGQSERRVVTDGQGGIVRLVGQHAGVGIQGGGGMIALPLDRDGADGHDGCCTQLARQTDCRQCVMHGYDSSR